MQTASPKESHPIGTNVSCFKEALALVPALARLKSQRATFGRPTRHAQHAERTFQEHTSTARNTTQPGTPVPSACDSLWPPLPTPPTGCRPRRVEKGCPAHYCFGGDALRWAPLLCTGKNSDSALRVGPNKRVWHPLSPSIFLSSSPPQDIFPNNLVSFGENKDLFPLSQKEQSSLVSSAATHPSFRYL